MRNWGSLLVWKSLKYVFLKLFRNRTISNFEGYEYVFLWKIRTIFQLIEIIITYLLCCKMLSCMLLVFTLIYLITIISTKRCVSSVVYKHMNSRHREVLCNVAISCCKIRWMLCLNLLKCNNNAIPFYCR